MSRSTETSQSAETAPRLVEGLALTGLTADSRKVRPGFLFAALPGTRVDGRAYVAEAIQRGAVAILAPVGTEIEAPVAPGTVHLITDSDPRRRFALMAAAFHGRQPAVMAAVTGTNGKTSTADFTRQIWDRLGLPAASIGTLGIKAPGRPGGPGLTTPDPEALHADLAALAESGIDHACIEASSHGLAQRRLDGVRIRAAAFTNLTRDHLDYHGDMESYAQAKLRLFSDVLAADGTAVINADQTLADRIAAAAGGRRILTYGREGRDLRLTAATPDATGQTLALEVMGRPRTVHLPLAGAFQAANVLAALGLVLATGGDADAAIDALAGLKGVPGRLQLAARHRSGAPIYVDYAHTPDALETVLSALRPHVGPHGKLAVVFGCGGDRDAGKRPEMGAIARARADRIIVTDDNPRGEDPALIRRAILAACPDALEIGDRAQAIRRAVAELGPGDVLVVAGKGHERGQLVGGAVLPFDDCEQVGLAVSEDEANWEHGR
jgi:UDP-N-acetylmuramoyl-L-alanyl-D-glutamate--2,6-diaminopimelate ligase